MPHLLPNSTPMKPPAREIATTAARLPQDGRGRPAAQRARGSERRRRSAECYPNGHAQPRGVRPIPCERSPNTERKTLAARSPHAAHPDLLPGGPLSFLGVMFRLETRVRATRLAYKGLQAVPEGFFWPHGKGLKKNFNAGDVEGGKERRRCRRRNSTPTKNFCHHERSLQKKEDAQDADSPLRGSRPNAPVRAPAQSTRSAGGYKMYQPHPVGPREG